MKVTFILAVLHISILHFAYMIKSVADNKEQTVKNQYTETEHDKGGA